MDSSIYSIFGDLFAKITSHYVTQERKEISRDVIYCMIMLGKLVWLENEEKQQKIDEIVEQLQDLV